jgi:hypothetical protein
VDVIAEADSSVSDAAREAALGVSVAFDVEATSVDPGVPSGGSIGLALSAPASAPGGSGIAAGNGDGGIGGVGVAGAAPGESGDAAGVGEDGSMPGRPAFGGVFSLMTMGRRVSYARR